MDSLGNRLASGKPKFWISGAFHPAKKGELRKYAEKHHLITHEGTKNPDGIIDLDRTENYARAHLKGDALEQKLDQIHFARNVR